MSYIKEFDGLRGLLALCVLFGHIFGAFLERSTHPFPWYWGAMEVFFTLSGFLIGRNLFSKYKIFNIKAYFINRILRIWPMYYFVFIVCLIVTLLVPLGFRHAQWVEISSGSSVGNLVSLLFLQNVETYWSGRLQYMALFEHSWSVALEEQFYVIAPFIIILFRARSLDFMFLVWGLVSVISALYIYWGGHSWTMLVRFPAFYGGVLIALIDSRSSCGLLFGVGEVFVFRMVFCLSLIVLFPYVVLSYFELTIDPFLAKSFFNPYLGFMLLGFGIVGLIKEHGLPHLILGFFGSGAMRFFGRISYSIYLLQIPIITVLVPWALGGDTASVWGCVVISFCAVVLSSLVTYRLIEVPFLRLKRF